MRKTTPHRVARESSKTESTWRPGSVSYEPSLCGVVIAAGKEGKSRTEIAAQLGISRTTLYSWVKKHPEFGEAMELAETHSQAWWEREGRAGMWAGKQFNASLWAKSVSCRFPKDYREGEQPFQQSGSNNTLMLFPPTAKTMEEFSENAAKIMTEQAKRALALRREIEEGGLSDGAIRH